MVQSTGTSSNDIFLNTYANDVFDGLGGYDVVNRYGTGYRGGHFDRLANGDVTFTIGNEVDTYRDIEQVDFVDGRMLFDVTEPTAQVVRLYDAALGRDYDQSGLNAHTTALYHGSNLNDVAESFVDSPEFQARYGADLSSQGYVQLLYQNALGREADTAGLQFWTDHMSQGMTRAEVLVGFSESAEAVANSADVVGAGIWDRSENAAVGARLYDTLLDRAPEGPGLIFWTDGLDQGYRQQVLAAEGFLASDEAHARYGDAQSSQDFIQALYHNAFDREGAPTEIQFWTNLIDTHALSKAEALLSISESAEHVQLTADNIVNDHPAQFGIALFG
jgi:hypothetical protein